MNPLEMNRALRQLRLADVGAVLETRLERLSLKMLQNGPIGPCFSQPILVILRQTGAEPSL